MVAKVENILFSTTTWQNPRLNNRNFVSICTCITLITSLVSRDKLIGFLHPILKIIISYQGDQLLMLSDIH